MGIGAAEPAHFGAAIAVSEEWAVVGAPRTDSRAGTVTLYRRDGETWVREDQFSSLDTEAGDGFGSAVALRGDALAVGAPGHDGFGIEAGAVYIFRRVDSVWTQETKLPPRPPFGNERFGYSVALEGPYLAVGAYLDRNPDSVRRGSATLFRDDGQWSHVATQYPPQVVSSMFIRFGRSVAISGDRLVVGAPRDGRGTVYVYEITPRGTELEACLVGSDLLGTADFGERVDICGTTIVAGAPRHGDPEAGAAYVFSRVSGEWVEVQKFEPGMSASRFGVSLALEEDRLAISASRRMVTFVFELSGNSWVEVAQLSLRGGRPHFLDMSEGLALAGDEILVGNLANDAAGQSSGAVYQFREDTLATSDDPNGQDPESLWREAARLPSGVGEAGDQFGLTVAGDGTRIAVGAPTDSDGVARREAGSVWIFEPEGTSWFPETQMVAADAQPFDRFGSSIAIAEGLTAVGAPAADGEVGDTGAVYLFREFDDQWQEEAKLFTPRGASGDDFGAAVAVAKQRVVVGAPFHDSTGRGPGAVFVFDDLGGTWTAVQTLEPTTAATRFGTAILLIDDEFLLVGAPGDESSTHGGVVEVFRQQGGQWIADIPLTPASSHEGDAFGTALAYARDVLVVGSPGASLNAKATGTVTLFRREGSNWVEDATLFEADGTDGDRFGEVVAAIAKRILVGVPGARRVALWEGRPDVWLQAPLVPPAGSPTDGFGTSVHLDSRGQALVGAPGGLDRGIRSGILIRYWTARETDCNRSDEPDVCDLATGRSPDCNDNGIPDECDIASRTSRDANDDGVPDECETYRLAQGSGHGRVGDTVRIRTNLVFSADAPNVGGLSYGVCHDPDIVNIDCTGGFPNDCVDNGVIVQGSALQAIGGAGFFAPAVATTPFPGYTVGIVVSLFDGQIPNTGTAEVVVASYQCLAPGQSPLEICVTGDPRVLLSVGIVGGGDVEPTVQDGLITVIRQP